jgi:hypothetical protein
MKGRSEALGGHRFYMQSPCQHFVKYYTELAGNPRESVTLQLMVTQSVSLGVEPLRDS